MAETELPSTYEPGQIEPGIYRRWLESEAFRAVPDRRDERYVVMMPLPNVTGALHMGHAMDNVMQDLLVRWHRMRGANTLWQPGTDHAGIATQAVVEKRLRDEEGLPPGSAVVLVMGGATDPVGTTTMIKLLRL